MTADAPERFAPGQILAGKLRIVRRLGSGGMGVVYEVEHLLTHHRRALKVLHVGVSQRTGAVERFLREATAAGRVGSPHLVETFDVGQLETGEPYHLMELLEGQTLSEWLERRGPLPLGRACALMRQASRALEAAHRAGVIHRDVKPENLFLVGPDASFVKLLDFGVCQLGAKRGGGGRLTMDGAPLGTPLYMSPEQIRGELTLDERSDVWALGVVLYECLSGKPPFEAERFSELAALIHAGRYTPLTTLRPELPHAVDRVIARALAADPARRWASAAALEAELALLEGAARREAGGAACGELGETEPGAAPETSVPPTSRTLSEARSGDPEPAERPRRRRWERRAVALGGIAGVALLLGLGMRVSARHGRGDPAEGALHSPPPGASALVPAAPATSGGAAPPAARGHASPRTPSQAVSSARVPAAAKPPPARPATPRSPSIQRPPAARSTAPSSTSRAREHGLVEENPF